MKATAKKDRRVEWEGVDGGTEGDKVPVCGVERCALHHPQAARPKRLGGVYFYLCLREPRLGLSEHTSLNAVFCRATATGSGYLPVFKAVMQE